MAEKTPDSIVTFVKEKSEEGQNWEVIRQIQINRAFYAGYQWISYDQNQRRPFVPQLRAGEKRYTYNKIKPAITTLLAKTTKNRVKLEVKPDTNDIDRIETAKAGLKLLHYQWDKDRMDNKTRRIKFLMLLDGCPALEVYVDPKGGEPLEVDQELLDEMEKEGKPVDNVPQKSGVICTTVLDQFSLKVDPNAEDIEDVKWYLKETPVDVSEIQEEWGVEVEPENIQKDTPIISSMGISTQQGKKYQNHAMVRDYWEEPCVKYPKGRRYVVAGDRTLLKEESDPGECPYILFPAIPLPGMAIGTGVVTDMTTPQRSYNIKRTAEARILEEMGNPMWLHPQGSVENPDELADAIGGIVNFIPIGNSEPKRVAGVEPGAGWQAAMDRDALDMDDISGAHEISRGAAQPGNDTLGGLQLQVEQDETKLALIVESFEQGIQKWGEKVLRLVRKHFPEEQQLSIVGENGEIEAFTFAGADLTGNETVDVIPGSSMPTLKVVQDQKVMQMFGAGMFNDPKTGLPDTKKVVRMLGESIAEEYFDDTEQDENKALMENRTYQMTFSDQQKAQALTQFVQQMQQYQMAQQQAQAAGVQLPVPPPQSPVPLPIVRDFYDHEVHIRTHNRFRKSDEYDKLPPEFQTLVDQHVAEHVQMLMAPMMQAQAQQQEQQQQLMDQQNQQAVQQQQADQQAQQQQAEQQQHAQVQGKVMDHHMKLQQEQQKANNAMQLAAIQGGRKQ